MQKKTIEINGETLSYYDGGRSNDKGRSNVTLLFLHGAFIHKDYWIDQIDFFASSYRVVALDMAGHGESSYSGNDWTLLRYGQDVVQFIEQLALQNIVVIGHSMGANIMLEVAHSIPDRIRGIVDIDHFKNVGEQMPPEVIAGLVMNLKQDFSGTAQAYAQSALISQTTAEHLVKRLYDDFAKIPQVVGIPLLESSFTYGTRQVELLRKLSLKLHMLHVDYSGTDIKSLETYLGNNFSLSTMGGTCHYPMVESPQEFNVLLECILTSKIFSNR